MKAFPPATLSRHAQVRLAERSALGEAQLVGILNQTLPKRVSVSKRRSNLGHRLYWSQPDAQFYVAVQDVISGSVVTVLTAEMFDSRYPNIITEKQCNQVLNKAILAGHGCSTRWRSEAETRSYVFARLVCGSHLHSEALGRWQARISEPTAEAVGAMEQFWNWVVARMSVHGWPLAALERVSLRLPFRDDVPVPYLR